MGAKGGNKVGARGGKGELRKGALRGDKERAKVKVREKG